jgi:hypothetical protein
MRTIKTLGDYKKLCEIMFPNATEFIQKKINESPYKEKEEVWAHESQMLYLLNHINMEKKIANKK